MNKILAGVALAMLLLVSPLHSAPQIEEVQALIGNINLPGDRFSSLAIDMMMRLPGTPVELLCQLRYQAPDRYSLQVFDGFDQTPVLLVTDSMALINDPFAEQLTLIASAGVLFELQPQEGRYNANFAFNMPGDREIVNRAVLDFKTMFARLQKDINIEVASNGSLIFSGTSTEDSRCLAEINASAAFPLQFVRVFTKDSTIPVLDFKLIRADESFVMPLFPATELKESNLPVVAVNPQGVLDTMTIMSSVFKAVFARAAIRDAAIREEISKMLQLPPTDWNGAALRDTSRGETLRRMFPAGQALSSPIH
ncbi:MAG TPA: hypothetical protein PLM07_11160 [Candidatus Rifleibacterium sp.]|nr:hypothetical protein [Candidatus Rifleibacterium sp.]HPT46450.1 hypothetical protein [Candidatus Rifleibacterium sp.]